MVQWFVTFGVWLSHRIWLGMVIIFSQNWPVFFFFCGILQDLPTASSWSLAWMAWEWLGRSWELEGRSPSAPGWRSTGTLRKPSLKAPSPIQDGRGPNGVLNRHCCRLQHGTHVTHIWIYRMISRIIEGSLEVNFRQYGEMEKQRWEESGRRRQEMEKIKEGESRGKMQVREKVGKSRFTVFFPMIWGSGQLGAILEVAMSKNCTPLWREAHFQVKSVKTWGVRTTFWRSDVEKVDTD